MNDLPPLRYGVLDGLMGYAIRRAQLRLYADFTTVMAGTGCTPPVFAALTLIVENPGLSQARLAAGMGLVRSAANPLLASLGPLVERRVVDGRTHGLFATPAGRRRQAGWAARIAAHDARMLAGLRPAQVAALRRLLERLGTTG